MKYLKLYENFGKTPFELDPPEEVLKKLGGDPEELKVEEASSVAHTHDPRADNAASKTVGEHETFQFFTKRFDIAKAWKMIEADPERFMIDGEHPNFNLEGISNWFSYTTPEQKAEFEKTGKMSVKMGVKVNYDYALSLPKERLEKPGIWISDGRKDFDFLIDGWQRAFARHTRGDKTMSIWVFQNPEDIDEIMY